MIRRLAWVSLIAATLAVGGSANAQQRPTPVPTGGGNNSALKPDKPLPTLRFPASAATYDQYVQYWLKLVRKTSTTYHVSQGDTNKVILFVKDCASRVEADGYVTASEANYCRSQTLTMVHDVATPYMMQAAGDGNN